MAGLNDYPIKFDSTTIPFFPTTWQRTPKKIQNTNQSEGGSDIVQVIRTGKMSISVAFAIADDTWVKFFEEYSEKDSFQISEYSPKTGAYQTITVRMEDFSDGARRKSYGLTSVKGVWDVTFTLEEF